MKKFLSVLMLLCVFVLSGCGDGKSPKKVDDADSGSDVSDSAPADTEPADTSSEEDNFDPANSGYTVEFNIIDIEMMGQGQSMAIGYFMKTAREDLEEVEVEDVTLDTCVMGESSPRVPSCTSKADCAPEQECVPEYNNGQPIENSEHCETPGRESLDVGPVEIAGFNDGPYTFAFEPGDQLYKINGTGDGSIDRSIIAYDTEYTISADDLIPEDLKSLSAKFTMPPALSLIEPVMVEGGMFGKAVEIDNTKPITFKWESNGGKGYIDITIMAAQSLANVVSVTCKVKDDGEFTVPEEFTSQLVFGGGGDGMMDQMLGMMNMITMDRHSEAPITGDGISSGRVSSEQLVMISVVPAGSIVPEPEPEPDPDGDIVPDNEVEPDEDPAPDSDTPDAEITPVEPEPEGE
ncbi:hypothetical protein J5681_01110 [bacterium]|nr:hypothetical protein [bacterium]